jgi:hypothetical protein
LPNMGHFEHFQKNVQCKNHPTDENLSNLVALSPTPRSWKPQRSAESLSTNCPSKTGWPHLQTLFRWNGLSLEKSFSGPMEESIFRLRSVYAETRYFSRTTQLCDTNLDHATKNVGHTTQNFGGTTQILVVRHIFWLYNTNFGCIKQI